MDNDFWLLDDQEQFAPRADVSHSSPVGKRSSSRIPGTPGRPSIRSSTRLQAYSRSVLAARSSGEQDLDPFVDLLFDGGTPGSEGGKDGAPYLSMGAPERGIEGPQFVGRPPSVLGAIQSTLTPPVQDQYTQVPGTQYDTLPVCDTKGDILGSPVRAHVPPVHQSLGSLSLQPIAGEDVHLGSMVDTTHNADIEEVVLTQYGVAATDCAVTMSQFMRGTPSSLPRSNHPIIPSSVPYTDTPQSGGLLLGRGDSTQDEDDDGLGLFSDVPLERKERKEARPPKGQGGGWDSDDEARAPHEYVPSSMAITPGAAPQPPRVDPITAIFEGADTCESMFDAPWLTDVAIPVHRGAGDTDQQEGVDSAVVTEPQTPREGDAANPQTLGEASPDMSPDPSTMVCVSPSEGGDGTQDEETLTLILSPTFHRRLPGLEEVGEEQEVGQSRNVTVLSPDCDREISDSAERDVTMDMPCPVACEAQSTLLLSQESAVPDCTEPVSMLADSPVADVPPTLLIPPWVPLGPTLSYPMVWGGPIPLTYLGVARLVVRLLSARSLPPCLPHPRPSHLPPSPRPPSGITLPCTGSLFWTSLAEFCRYALVCSVERTLQESVSHCVTATDRPPSKRGRDGSDRTLCHSQDSMAFHLSQSESDCGIPCFSQASPNSSQELGEEAVSSRPSPPPAKRHTVKTPVQGPPLYGVPLSSSRMCHGSTLGGITVVSTAGVSGGIQFGTASGNDARPSATAVAAAKSVFSA
ncbi:hypothetical protein KIPB_010460, partial [Kipferlia bialata]|eukprot:g10460.t1